MSARLPLAAWLCCAALLLPARAWAQPKWPSSSAPRPLAAREVKFPPYELRSLPNGLQVVVVMHTEQPAVSVRLIVRAGGAHDPAAKPGVAALLTSVLDQGTTTMNAQTVAETIDTVGGQLATGVGRDLLWAHVVVMKDSFALGTRLLADVVRRPALAEEEVERQRQQTLSALRVSQQNPEYLANILIDRLVYGSNPYGAPGNGTPETVASITRDDLVAFHRAHFAPNNCLLAVVGDVTVDEAMEVVTKAFGDWPRQEVPAFDPGAPPEPARRVVVVDKPDAVQTEIRVAQVGIPRRTADYTAVDLALKILGGEGANRLYRVLRIERGLTYGASAELETLQKSGQFVVQTNTRSDATGEVLRLIVDEYWKLRRERVNDGELTDAKAYLAGHFPLTIETPDEIAIQVLNALFYGLPLDELQTFRQRVNAVDVDDVARVAWKYLRPDKLAVVLVGNAGAFLGQLKGVGFGRYELVRASDLDLGAADFKRKAAPPTEIRGAARRGPITSRLASYTTGAGQASRAASERDPAQSLLSRVIRGKGGVDRLKSIATVEAVATNTVTAPGGPVEMRATTSIRYPDCFRLEQVSDPGPQRGGASATVTVYAGEGRAWSQDPVNGVHDLRARELRASVDRDVIRLLLRAESGELAVRLGKKDDTDGPNVEALEISGPDLGPITLLVEASSGLILKERYRLPDGRLSEETYSDYRDVDGVRIAFRARIERVGFPLVERTVTSFRLNPPLAPGLFDKPGK